MGYGKLKKALICDLHESYFNVRDFKQQHINPHVNKDKAIMQFGNFRRAFVSAGIELLEIPEIKEDPNSVFVRDTAAITKEGFIRMRMGLISRRGEEAWMADFLRSNGYKEVGRVYSPGTAEGGDVIIGENVAFVGISQRTNSSGAEQVAKILEQIGYEVRIAKFKGPFLHIGGGMSLIGNNTVLYCKDAFPGGFFDGFNKIPMQCNDFIGGNIIAFSEKEVLSLGSNTEAIKHLQIRGINVHKINLSEFVKGNGGPSCMVLPLG